MITPDFLNHTTAQILDPYLGPDDLTSATIAGQGPQVGRYRDLRNRLQNFSAIDPNPLRVGEAPPRKILATTFQDGINLTAQSRRISYLRRFGELSLLVYNVAQNKLEAWWNVGALTQKQLKAFFTRCCEVNVDPRSGLRGHKVCVPNGVRASGLPIFTQMRAWNLVSDIDALNRL